MKKENFLKHTTFLTSVFFIFTMLFCLFSNGRQAQAMTPVEIRAKYNAALETGKKVNVLIVPGHDDDYWGTEFGDVREADVVVAIGQYLHDYLKTDPRLNVTISRTQMGYNPIFKAYFENNRQAIQDFITTSRSTQQAKISAGDIKPSTSVPHNTVNSEIATRLYGINKWANENNIDITIHLHINDQGGRRYGVVGDYTGITVYIPENQYQNAGASAVLGEAIYKELLLKNHSSTYPAEARGLVEDQDLIAIGASDTVKNAVALIEYGYIYEPQFRDLNIQEQVTKDLAYQTFLGLHRFFGDKAAYAVSSSVSPRAVPTIPATTNKVTKLTKSLSKNMTGAEVSLLQNMLTKAKVYSCGITATFGPCTEKGVKAFQKKYKIEQTGTVGPTTRAKLNSLFGS